ncbi:putative Tfp pilus assembly protein PilP [Sterolibacterium denitrificans]|uniref:Tfp pilus assembly protein PilP n=2 Tax=Sterolibacterium denitrificans TaxID=157592 RepID=A0A7Z7MVC3_9PROT|nr:putative Tfp pilus assembly protein PilP [Sterolibacterium denitrificans]
MNRLSITLSMLAALLLVGCMADEHQDIKQWMQEASKSIKGKIPPLPEIRPFPIVSYDAGDLVDPFNSLRIETGKKGEGSGLRPDPNRYKEPLEAYPLESLKMVGVVREKGRTSAMVLADKTVHTVRLGNYMGQNFGMIVGITDTEIQLKELVQEQDSEWVERATSLQLQEQETKK